MHKTSTLPRYLSKLKSPTDRRPSKCTPLTTRFQKLYADSPLNFKHHWSFRRPNRRASSHDKSQACNQHRQYREPISDAAMKRIFQPFLRGEVRKSVPRLCKVLALSFLSHLKLPSSITANGRSVHPRTKPNSNSKCRCAVWSRIGTNTIV
jgi:hypothetical protein